LIKELVETLRKATYGFIVLDVLNVITRHHRIQGSRGLENTLVELREALNGIGYSTKFVEVPSDTSKGLIDSPLSWDVEEASLVFSSGGKAIGEFNLVEHPTLVAAHSPPGEGCAELSVCSGFECKGRAVLVKGPAYDAYKRVDADLIVVYDPKRYIDAVPYTGLFLRSSEVKDTVVMNIPYRTALTLLSMLVENPARKITVCWKSKSRYSSRPMHALVACNSEEEPGVLFTSHICHPKPGAHDNASGSAANYMIAFASSATRLKIPLCHAWIPEYTGTVYLDKALPWQPIGVINLDMVGSKQWITGSTLNIVNTPLYMESLMAPYVYLAVKSVFDNTASFGGFQLPGSRYSLSPYTAGSDHDVLLSWGFDTIMLNEWPSKYYHTDMDSVDTISPLQVSKTAISSLLAAYLAFTGYKRELVESIFLDYLKSWYSIEALKQGLEPSASDVSRILNRTRLKPGELTRLPSPVSTRAIQRILGLEDYMRVREVKGAISYLTLYAPLAYVNGINEHLQMFQLENIIKWSNDEEMLIRHAWETIMNSVLK